MGKVLVSIVIPVFNVEEYLEVCVFSLLHQTYKDLEFIFVDDGSTDNSLTILKDFQELDNRIRIIELKENYGPGNARNLGIEEATGKYILFVDSDDYILEDTVLKLLESWREDADICIYNGYSFNDETNEEYKRNYFYIPIEFFEKKEIKEEEKLILASLHSPCMKVYRTDFLKNKQIFFPGFIYGEDVEFWIKCLLNTNKIQYVDLMGYRRRIRKSSIMYANSLKNVEDRVNNFEELLKLCKDAPCLYSYVSQFYIPQILNKVNQRNELCLKLSSEILMKRLIQEFKLHELT